MTSFFESNCATVALENKWNAVRIDWLPVTLTSDTYRATLEQGFALAQQAEAVAWLANLKEMRLINTEDEAWTNRVWFPKLVAETKVRRMAIVLSEDTFNRVAVKSIMKQEPAAMLLTKYFESMAAAGQWLSQMARQEEQ